jgi:lysine/ornithine N-monooxygenase
LSSGRSGRSGLDFVGIGFGQSNLALAVAADGIVSERKRLFL